LSRLSSLKKFTIPFPNNPFIKLFLVISFFVFATFFVPGIGYLFLLLLPMILFFNGTVNGTNKTVVAFLISFFLLSIPAMFLSSNVPFIAVFIMGISGLFMAQCAVRNFSIEKTIVYPVIFVVAAICFFFIYEGYILSTDPWLLVKKNIAASIAELVKQYSQLPISAENINLIKDNENNMINDITRMFPSIVIISATLVIWINFILGRNYLGKAGIIFTGFIALARWKVPDFIIWIFIVSGALLFMPYENINFFGSNIFLVTCFIYFLQGLAIVSFFFQIKNAPYFLRFLFYFLIAVEQFFMIPIITAVGLFDIWIDFRKFFQKDQTTN
jgi:uncharacterized protein YybS (DUF2232 family)